MSRRYGGSFFVRALLACVEAGCWCLRGMSTWDAGTGVGCLRGDAGTGVVIQIVNRSVTHWKQCVRLHLIDPGIG